MESYYRELSSRNPNTQRSADEIAQARVDDLSLPYERSSFPNAISLEAHRALTGDQSTASQLDSSNIGHRMLERMGWVVGTGLGKQRNGMLEPVQAVARTKGLGVGAGTTLKITEEDDGNDNNQPTHKHQRRQNHDGTIILSRRQWRLMEKFLRSLSLTLSFAHIHPSHRLAFGLYSPVYLLLSTAFTAFRKRKISAYNHRPNPLVSQITISIQP